jgi:hypothetical protein
MRIGEKKEVKNKMWKRLVVMVSVLALVLSIFTALGSFPVRAESDYAAGTILNVGGNITTAFTVRGSNAGTAVTVEATYDPDPTPNTGDPVVYPQFNDTLSLWGAFKDANGEQSSTQDECDELVNATNGNAFNFTIWYHSTPNSGDLTDLSPYLNGDGYWWNASAVADGATFDTADGFSMGLDFALNDQDYDGGSGPDRNGIVAVDGDDTGEDTAGGEVASYGASHIDWATDGSMNANVTGWYHEIRWFIEDNNGYDIRDDTFTVQPDTAMPNGSANENDAVGVVGSEIALGFYCRQAYKIIGVYNISGGAWENDNPIREPGTAPQWNFTSVAPDGTGTEWDKRTWSTGWLAIQWLMPASNTDAYLNLDFDNANFEYREGVWPAVGLLVDTIPNNDGLGTNGFTNFTGRVDTVGAELVWGTEQGGGVQIEVLGAAGAGYTPGDGDMDGWENVTDDLDTKVSWFADGDTFGDPNGGVDELEQFYVLFVRYMLFIPSITADGFYTCPYTVSASQTWQTA